MSPTKAERFAQQMKAIVEREQRKGDVQVREAENQDEAGASEPTARPLPFKGSRRRVHG